MVEKIRANKTARVLAITCIIAFALMLFVVSCKKHEEPQHAPTVVKVIPPTCETMGYTEYTCEHCGIYYADYTDALGHNYGEPCAIGIVRCTERTTYESYCDRCNATRRSSKAAAGHSYAEVSENEIEVTYECQACHEILVLPAEETPEVFVGSEELFDVEPSFTFDVVTTNGHGIDFIRDTLVILDSYFYGTEYEADAIIEYEITENNGSWTISFPEGYEYGTTYVAKLSDGLKFVDYKANELYFGIKNDPDHQNEHQYKDGIVFVRALENASKGYYPLELNTSKNSKYIYLTIGKVDGISKGQTLCVGEVTDVSQINANTVCTMGKVEDIYEISAGKWMVVMSAPEITDVFEGLDVVYTGAIKFDDAELNVAMLGAAVRDAFYESEQFAELLGAVNLSAGRYLADRGYHSYALDSLDAFMSNVRVDPYVSVQDTTLYAKLNGTITLDVRDSSERQTGTLTIAFDAEITSQFIVDAEYKTKKWGFVSLPSVNISIKQNDNVKFNFDVAIDIDGLEDSGYVRNAKTGEVHLACCVEVTRANDPSSFEKITAANANASANKCTHCRPENGANLKNDFNSYYINTIYCSDWEEVVANIKRLTSANTEKEVNVDLKSINIPIGGTPVNIGVDFGVCFGIDIGAIMDYSCEYSQTSVYGMRLNFDDVQVFSQKEKSNFSKNDLAVIGSANVRTGITVQANINIAGLSQCSAGIIADVGAYADISGVRDSELGMTGAYLEVGAFYDVDAFYNFFAMSDSLGVDADKYPIQKYGYDKVYFSYDVYRDTLSLGSSYDIAANDLLVVRYYDTKKMQIGKDELSLNEKNKYKVTLSLENGTYCEIKNGKIITKINAPETFTDVLNITVTASNSWGEYKRGSSAYHLGSYTIILEFKLDHVHSWADATCDTPRTCTKCGSKDGGALGHNYTYFSDNNATCTENGTETAICSRCNAVSTRTISGSALGHDYNYVIQIEATCTENAIETATCTRCGKVDTRTVYGSALGHNYQEYTIHTEATCTENAIETATCSRCLSVDTKTITGSALGHDYNYIYNNDATCTKNGTQTATCTRCQKVSTQPVSGSALGHDYQEYVLYTEATCTKNATEIATCSRCTSTKTRTITGSALGHDYQEYVLYTEATCTQNATERTTCSRCTSTKTRTISGSALGHDYNYIYNNNATCTENGTETAICPRCNSTDTKIVPNTVLGHDHKNYAISIAATCTTDAVEASSCSRCGNIDERTVVGSALGHNESDWIIDKAANDEEDGIKHTECTRCRILLSQTTIPATASKGLAFKFNTAKKSYSVSGIGTCTDTNIKIPSTYNGYPVTAISRNAFKGKTSLTGIEIPDSVTTIESSAFSGCTKLTTVIIGNSVKEIGDGAFGFCSSIQTIIIPNSVETIGSGAFHSCSALTSVSLGNSLKNIEYNAFTVCSKLTSITIPDSVTTIGENAFNDCYALTNLTIGRSLNSIGRGAFYDCLKLNNIEVSKNNNYFQSIDGNLYSKDGKTLILYAIGKKDSSFAIPSFVTNIGEYAFMQCKSFINITIPNSVTSIGNAAFSGCSSLTSITLPNSVTSIGNSAFSGCSSLTSITLPNSVTIIGDHAFSSCSSLANITIPNSVTSIGDYTFSICSSLANITIPNSVTIIGNGAFSYCKNLANITIPNSVVSIGDEAFYECIRLTSINIPSSVTTIGINIVSGCANLTSIEVDIKNTAFMSINGNLYTKDGKTLMQYAPGKTDKTFTIPNSVTTIKEYAVSYCNHLTNVIIPNSVTNIEKYAFVGSSIVSINIPNSITKINYATFASCSYLANIIIPSSVTSIGDEAFSDCYSLTNIIIPDSVTTIGSGAFNFCRSLKSISIGSSIKNIKTFAFAHCDHLDTIQFNGTIAQWNAITKGSNWNSETGEYTIYCTDGKISKDGTVTYN